jgi:flagellar motor switch protein FliM
MTSNAVLDQDEIDALIHGVDSGTVKTESEAVPGTARSYDFATQVRIVRGRMPTLEMINERFIRLLRTSLFGMMRRTPEITVGPVKVVRFSEYVQTLHVPSSLNLVKVTPLRGTGLVVFNPKLVFALVDNFFGGTGRHAKIEGREFTATESRIVQLVLKLVFADMQLAWSNVTHIQLEYLSSEVNPQFANIVSPTESVVVSDFHLELEGGSGSLQFTVPSTMLEPVRELLDAGVVSDRIEHDDRWVQALKEEVEDVEVDLHLVLGRGKITLAELLNLKPGDVVPVDFSGRATVVAEDVPVFRGNYGVSHGMHALKIGERIMRNKLRILDALMRAPSVAS